jgi:hypothetical protein
MIFIHIVDTIDVYVKCYQEFVRQVGGSRITSIQVHTGLQAGNGNTLENSRPTQLANLFLKYPRVIFDPFHLGSPWVTEVAAARNALHEMLETVPANKLLGFDGNYRQVELSYARAWRG